MLSRPPLMSPRQVRGHTFSGCDLRVHKQLLEADHSVLVASACRVCTGSRACSARTCDHDGGAEYTLDCADGCVDERRWWPGSSCGHRAEAPFKPSHAALRRRDGRALPPMSAIATSQALYAALQGQQEQARRGGALIQPAPSPGVRQSADAVTRTRVHRPAGRALLRASWLWLDSTSTAKPTAVRRL